MPASLHILLNRLPKSQACGLENFFLTREMRDERETTEDEGESPRDLPPEGSKNA